MTEDLVVLKKVQELDALVSSESCKGAYYHVKIDGSGARCTCPNHQYKGADCKHIQKARGALA